MSSFMRNVNATSNSITKPMQMLADGGGLYTNAPCPGCHVSRNYFAGDPTVYGCLYHDGGSSLWADYDNVFNDIQTSSVFCHGGSGGIVVDGIYMNNSGSPSLQGATNKYLNDSKGVCVTPTMETLGLGASWTGVAADVVAQAGRRLGALPPLVAPTVSPPVNQTADNEYMADTCVHFAVLPCVPGKPSQRWVLSEPAFKPGSADSGPMTIRSAISNGTNQSCWEAANCGWGGTVEVTAQDGETVPTVCEALPPAGWHANASARGSCVDTFPQASHGQHCH
jgi:hypothetical protein